MGDTFVMSSRQAAEFDHALERNGWTSADVKALSGGDVLARLLPVVKGYAEVVEIDFFRETGEFEIQTPALPCPSLEELKAEFPWIKEIEGDTSPTEAVTLRLGTVMRLDEQHIDGLEYERRFTPKLDLALGYQQAVWLVEHQSAFPAFMAQLGRIYIDFPGLVVVDANGDRRFPCLRRDGERWSLDWRWLGHGLRRNGRVAVSCK